MRAAPTPAARLLRTSAAVLVLFVLLPAGCARRVPIYSPRLADTPDHRGASRAADCLACHDLADRPTHSAGDPCLECHKIRIGGTR